MSRSVCTVWTANYCWPMVYFTTRYHCQEKGRGEEESRQKRLKNLANCRKERLQNTVIIFKNITRVATALAKNRPKGLRMYT